MGGQSFPLSHSEVSPLNQIKQKCFLKSDLNEKLYGNRMAFVKMSTALCGDDRF